MRHNRVWSKFTIQDNLLNLPTEPTTHIDNEYSRAGVQDPKIVITTSRDPSSKLLQFAKVRVFFLTCITTFPHSVQGVATCFP